MFFRYDVCDIDFYTEAAVGVAVRPARHGKLGLADMASSLANDHLHFYVLSLPVSTQIARVRGHDSIRRTGMIGPNHHGPFVGEFSSTQL